MNIEIYDTFVFVQLDTVTSGLDMLDQILRAFKNSVLLSGEPFWDKFELEIEQLNKWGFEVLLCAGHEYIGCCLSLPIDGDEFDEFPFD